MDNIGFSTGCLYKSGRSLGAIAEIFFQSGAKAIELSFATPEALSIFSLDEEVVALFSKFPLISIHAPWKNIHYGEGRETKMLIGRLKDFCAHLPIRGIVIHPDTIDDFAPLVSSGLPILLENMDERKKFGIRPADFEKLKTKCDFGFVLDLEHAFEHDQSLRNAKEFIGVMGSRLHHLHVSGRNKNETHAPLYLSDNQEVIAKILRLKIQVPIILEGVLGEDPAGAAASELSFLKNLGID